MERFNYVLKNYWHELIMEVAEHATAGDLIKAGLSASGCRALSSLCLRAAERLDGE